LIDEYFPVAAFAVAAIDPHTLVQSDHVSANEVYTPVVA
jgi:hypothetical protein